MAIETKLHGIQLAWNLFIRFVISFSDIHKSELKATGNSHEEKHRAVVVSVCEENGK